MTVGGFSARGLAGRLARGGGDGMAYTRLGFGGRGIGSEMVETENSGNSGLEFVVRELTRELWLLP